MPTVSKATVEVVLDGKGLPLEARIAGEKAGIAASQGFDDTFRERFSKIGAELAANMKKNGELSGNSFTDAMERVIQRRSADLSSELAEIFGNTDGLDKYFGSVTSVDEGLGELRGKLKDLNAEGNLSDKMWQRLGGTLNQYVGRARETEAQSNRVRLSTHDLKEELYNLEQNSRRVSDAFKGIDGDADRFSNTVRRAAPDVKVFGDELKKIGNDRSFSGGLGTDAKQIIAIIAIIAAAVPQILSLSSLIGSTVVLAVGSLAVLVAGLGVAIAGFVKLSGEVGKLPAQLQPAAQAFQDLMNPLRDLQTAITVSMFSQLAGPFRDLGQTIRDLTPAFAEFGGQVGQALGTIIGQLNSPAFKSGLTDFLAQAGPIFQSLVTAALSFGGAISNVILQSLPYVQKFVDGIGKIGDKFLEWTKSDAGRKAIQEFFEHGQQLAEPLLNLVGQLAGMFSRLVTDQTVAATGQFLDTISASLPFFEKLFDVLNQSNVLQVVADFLSVIGNALIPILDVIQPILQVAVALIEQALQPLGLVLQFVALMLEPLKIGFEIFGAILTAIQPYMTAIYSAFGEILSVVQSTADSIWNGIKPALGELMESFKQLLPSPQELHDILVNRVVPALQEAEKWFVEHLVPAISETIKWVKDFIDSLGGFEGIKDKVKRVIDVFNGFKTAAEIALAPIIALIKGIGWAIDAVNGKNLKVNANATGGILTKNGVIAYAAGGIVNRPTFLSPNQLAGEAGPEAIVPLSGPLSNVNPSVRDLAAYARGEGTTTTQEAASIHTWEAGAIIVQAPTDDPEQVAHSVLDNIIAGL